MKRIARVMVSDGRGHFLAILQSDKQRRVAFPGGHVEADETPEVAAARELKEETGLEALRLDFLGAIVGDDRETYLFAAIAEGVPRRSSEGAIFWARPEAFLQGRYGDFAARAISLWNKAHATSSSS